MYGESDEPEIVFDIAAIDEEEYNKEENAPLVESLEAKIDPMKTGFKWYIPPLAASKQSHTVGGHEWVISGHDMQILTSTVPAGEHVETEVGSFVYMSPFMTTEVELTLCTKGGFADGCNRICGGESCVKVFLKNDSSEEGYVGITPNYPAKIIPIQFGKHVASGSSVIAQPGVYMTQMGNVEVGCDLDVSITTCCCAGFGCCRQKMTGPDDSITFLAAGGTLVYKKLEADEQITVDSRSVVAFEDTVSLSITPNGRFCTCCFGGEGCFSTTLTGPGKVFMQSMAFRTFAEAVQQTVMEEREGTEIPDIS